MLGEACGLAVLAAISPTALLVCAAFLGSANPTKTVLIYLLGAFLVTVVTGGIVFAALRAGHLDEPRQHQARDGLRLGLGLLMLIAGLAVLLLARRTGRNGRAAARDARQATQRSNGKRGGGGFVARLLARPGASAAFLLGSAIYAPSITFVAAVQVVATSRSSLVTSIVALALVIAITIAFVWLPLLFYLVWPDRTGPRLTMFNGWLGRNGRLLVAGALLLAGLLLTADGASGLSSNAAASPSPGAGSYSNAQVGPGWPWSAAGMAPARPWVAI
jgi:hypothetical protein